MGTRYLGDALELSHDIKLEDQGRIKLGDAGNDLEISHSGTNSFIENNTGSLIFIQHVDDGDMIFQADDGSGGDTAYITLDGSQGFTTLQKAIRADDNVNIQAGSSGDFRIFHNGTNSVIQNVTGDVIIENTVDDKDIFLRSDDGNGGSTTYFSLDGSRATHDGSATTALFTVWPDNSYIALGNAVDLKLHHNGTNSTIENEVGDLNIINDANDGDIKFFCDDGSGGVTTYMTILGSNTDSQLNYVQFPDNIAATFGDGNDLRIYHFNGEEFIDNSTGDLNFRQIGVGDMIFQNLSDDKDIIFQSDDGSGGVTTYMQLDGSHKRVIFPNDIQATFGSSSRLSIKHDGTDATIMETQGDLKIINTADDKDIIFQSDDGSGGTTTYFFLDGSHGGNPITMFPDNSAINFGSTLGDLKISHDGSNSTINNGTGALSIRNSADDNDINFQCDDGSGGTTTYFYLDGSEKEIRVNEEMQFEDNVKLNIGTGEDLSFKHDGSNTFITNDKGNLTITNKQDDGDIIFECDDGSGGLATYITIDGSATNIKALKDIRFNDNIDAEFGTGGDFKIYHDGSNTYLDQINSGVGNIVIQNQNDDADIIFKSDDGSGGIETYFFLDGNTGQTRFPDSKILAFGSGGDLQIHHDSSHSYITQGTTGSLFIRQTVDDNDIIFQCDDGSGGLATYIRLDGSETRTTFAAEGRFNDSVDLRLGSDGDTQLMHNGSNAFINNFTGDLIISNAADDQDIIFKSDDGSGGTTAYVTLDGSATCVNIAQDIKLTALKKLYFDGGGDTYIVENASNNLQFVVGGNQKLVLGNSGTTHSQHFKLGDTNELQLGTDTDAQFQHTGTNLFLDNKTGVYTFRQKAENADIVFQGNDDAGNSTSVNITALTLDMSDAGTAIFNHDIKLADNGKAFFGGGTDLSIYHDGSNSYILQQTTGDLIIQNSVDDKNIILKSDDGSGGTTAYLTLDGTNTRTLVHQHLNLEDSVILQIGNSQDLKLFHSGTSSFISQEGVGDLYIRNTISDKDIYFQATDATGGTVTHFFLDGSLGDGGFTKFPDNTTLGIGSNADLRIKHDGTNTVMQEITGDLTIRNSADDKDIVFESDNGSGSTTVYFRVDGSAVTTIFSKPLRVNDSVAIEVGSGADLQLSHNGTNSSIVNYVGDLNITNDTNDGDINFACDDGSGGTTAYITLDGSVTTTKFEKQTLHSDNVEAIFGTGSDLKIKHDGTDSLIRNFTGSLIFRQTVDDGNITFQNDDGSGGIATYLTIDGNNELVQASKNFKVGDNLNIFAGTGNDLQIIHDGSDSFIKTGNSSTGDLYIRQQRDDGDIIFQSDDGSGGNATYITLDGSATRTVFSESASFVDGKYLYFGTGLDAHIKHSGSDLVMVNTAGDVTIQNSTDDGDIKFICDDGSGGTTEYFRIDGGSKQVRISEDFNFLDNAHADFGNSSDLKIYHDGSSSYIENNTGNLNIMARADDADMVFWGDDGTGGDGEYFRIDSSLSDASSDFRYTVWPDRSVIALGSGSDLQLYHNSVDSYVDNYVGDLYIRNTADDKDVIFQSDDGSGGVETYFFLDGSANRISTKVHNRFDDNAKLELGTSGDLVLFHDGSNSNITNATGNITITNNADDGDIIFSTDDGSGNTATYLTLDGGFSTPQVRVPDSVTFSVGNSQDLRLEHDGSNSRITQGGTGDLIIRQTVNDADLILQCDDGSGGETAYITLDGSTTKTVFNKPSQRTFAVSSTTDGDANGDIVFLGGTTSMTAGKIYHYKANGTWELADADSAVNCDGLLAVALGSASDTDGMLLRGMVTLDHDPGNLADVLFLSTTAGTATNTAPSGSGDIVRVIGYLLGGSNGQIYFNPDGTFVEVA